TVATSAGRAKREGIVIHRSTTLTKRDTTRRHNIPVTTLARTQRDLGFGPERTRSGLERDFLRLLKSHDSPRPEVNQMIGPYEVDFLWRAQRLVVEIDSWKYHRSRASFESDRARDRDLTLRGFEVLRFTDLDVERRGPETAGSLKAQRKRRGAQPDRSSSKATSST
ncbi:MAG: endonuclease domain-containing protein, partial [Solirubrobacterales bacterium]